jgi:predicted AAA+ superfamily ATPase
LIKNKGYIDSISTEDIFKQSGVRMDREKFKVLLKSIGRNISTCVTYSTLHSDINNTHYKGISDKTFVKYIQTLKDMFLFVEINSFVPNLRSKVRIQSLTKKILIDPSLACAAMNLTSEKFISDLNLFGFFFENLALRDLLVYANVLNGQLFHYRDNSNLEIDCILELDDGEYAAIEIKTGTDCVEKGIKNIKLFKQKMEKGGFKQPKFCMIIVGTGSFLHIEDDV